MRDAFAQYIVQHRAGKLTLTLELVLPVELVKLWFEHIEGRTLNFQRFQWAMAEAYRQGSCKRGQETVTGTNLKESGAAEGRSVSDRIWLHSHSRRMCVVRRAAPTRLLKAINVARCATRSFFQAERGAEVEGQA